MQTAAQSQRRCAIKMVATFKGTTDDHEVLCKEKLSLYYVENLLDTFDYR